MADDSQYIENTRKRLQWRATHRGIKEMDIVVGGFAAARLGGMNEFELKEFEQLLELPDPELLSWATKQEQVPADLSSPLLMEMISFRPVVS